MIKNVLVVHKLGYGNIEKKTINHVKMFLETKNILYRIISPLEVHPEMVKDRDLIIIVGGDGTFLKTAQHVHSTIPFLCINANIKKTEGFFSHTTEKNLEKKLTLILKEKAKKRILQRLQAKITGIEIEPCVNEYYIGQKQPYNVSQYILKIKNKKEFQKSSGILVSTPAGSTAWTHGAGGSILSLQRKQFQYIIREPYSGKLTKTTMLKGILHPRDNVVIIPKTEDMIVVADALGREHHILKGTKIEITMSTQPVYLFV